MHPRQEIPRSLQALALRQAGVLTSDQLRGGGLSPNVIRRLALEWYRPARGLYVLREPTWDSAAWAGLLRAGPDSSVTGEAAAFLHELVRDAPSRITVAATGQFRPLVVGRWQVEFRRVARPGRGTPSRARVEAAVVDMARDCTEDALVSALSRAFANQRTTPERVLAELEGRCRVRHASLIREMCEYGSSGIESALEWRFATQVLAPHGLPAPERQVVTHQGRVDALYRELGLVIELDGMRDHAEWSKDMMRDNEHLIIDDHRTLRYGWASVVYAQCAVADQVARVMRKLGWKGNGRRCRRCAVESAAEAA